MKKAALILLMCLSLSLQGINIPNGASAAQHYSNTAQGQINSYQDTLESDYATLQNLMNNMEIAMCGDNDSLMINTTSSGTTSTSSYTNCTGGAMGYLNSWSSQVNYWANIINQATNNKQWTTGYDACLATYQGPSGYNTNVYNDFRSSEVISYINNMNKGLNAIVGCTHNANPSTPYDPTTNPDPCPVDLPNNLLAVANTDSTKGPIGLIQNMITTMDSLSNAINLPGLKNQAQTINNTWEQYNTAVNTYSDCFKNNSSSFSALQVCATDFKNLLNTYETEINAMIALFEALLPLLPNVSGTYNLVPEPASIVCALAPEKCVVPDPNCNNCASNDNCNNLSCQYSLYNFNNFDINGTLQQIAAYVQTANNTVKDYNSKVTVMQNRLSALMNQLQILTNDVSSLQNSIKQINTNCKNDVQQYIAHQSNTLFDVISLIVGNILFMPIMSFTGGLGIPGLELLTMLLLQVPDISNNSIGLMTSIISQDLTQAIQNI